MGRGGVEFILVFKSNSCSCQSHIHPWLRRPDHLTHPSWWISGPVQTTLLGTRSAPATCPHTWESGGGDLISLFCPGQLISHWSSIFYYNGTLGKPSCKKSAVFLNIVQKAFDPPPFIWTFVLFCRGCFLKRFWALKMVVIMYLFHPQISPSMPQKSLFMQISCC